MSAAITAGLWCAFGSAGLSTALADEPCAPEWDSIIGQPGMSDSVNALAVHQGHLIAGGWFTSAGGQSVNYVARWDGRSWQPITAGGQTGLDAAVFSMTVYDGDLIVGGDFTTAGGQTVNRIARWDGEKWHALESGGQIGVNSRVDALAVHDGDLIAGGWFTTAAGILVNRIARWDGNEWHAFESGGQVGVGGATVLALASFNNDLVAGGSFTTAGGQTVNHIARWDAAAGQWHPLAFGSKIGVDNPVWRAVVFQGELVVAGDFVTSGGLTVNRIARWDGKQWSAIVEDGHVGVDGAAIGSLMTYEGDLIVGGIFNAAGGKMMNNVALWNGGSWMPLTSGELIGVNGHVFALAEREGDLIVGGAFSVAGGESANKIATWRKCAAKQPTGACCLPTGSCALMTSSTCAYFAGAYHGDDSICAEQVCAAVTPVVRPVLLVPDPGSFPPGHEPTAREIAEDLVNIDIAMRRVRKWWAGALGLTAGFKVEPVTLIETNSGLADFDITWVDPDLKYEGGIEHGNTWGKVIGEVMSHGFTPGTPEQPQMIVMFCKGAGGFAGGAQWFNQLGGGMCLMGDFTLDSLAERVPKEFWTWWTGVDKQTAVIAHEMGHTLGLPHPDLLNPVTGLNDFPYSVMGAWWDWPEYPVNPADPEWPLFGFHAWGENWGPQVVIGYMDEFQLAHRLHWFHSKLADLNNDGSVGVADLLILLANWGPCEECIAGGCPADLTGDCTVGVADLLILLANWG